MNGSGVVQPVGEGAGEVGVGVGVGVGVVGATQTPFTHVPPPRLAYGSVPVQPVVVDWSGAGLDVGGGGVGASVGGPGAGATKGSDPAGQTNPSMPMRVFPHGATAPEMAILLDFQR